VLEELESALARQLASLGQDDLDGVEAACARLEALVRAAEDAPPSAPGTSERLKRVRDLYRRLRLTLAERKSDLARRLDRIRRGRRTLRAYGERPGR
jgi:hypothetical protein